ncbi:MAG: hypothetical protein RL000_479 [Bacteroidota bacterium]
MMKFIVSFLICPLLAYALGMLLPWWSVAIAGFLTGSFIPQHRLLSFLSCFLGVLIFVGGLIYYISDANNHILAQKIGLLVLKDKNEFMIIGVSALIAALIAGISAITGRSLAIVVKKA